MTNAEKLVLLLKRTKPERAAVLQAQADVAAGVPGAAEAVDSALIEQLEREMEYRAEIGLDALSVQKLIDKVRARAKRRVSDEESI